MTDSGAFNSHALAEVSPPRRRFGQLRLLRYALKYPAAWGLIILATLGGSGLALLQPWPVQVLVDHVLGGRPMPGAVAAIAHWLPGARTIGGQVAWIAGAGLVFFLAGNLLDTVMTLSWLRAGQRTVYDLAADLFARLQRRSLVFHSRTRVGDLLGRVTADSWSVYRLIDALLLTPGQAIVGIVLMAAIMWKMDIRLTLVALAAAPVMAVSTYLLARRIRRTAKRRREIESQIQSHLQQTLTGIAVVQAFAQEERELDRFTDLADAAVRFKQRNVLWTNVGSLWAGLVTTLGLAAVLLIGADDVLAGRLTVGKLLVFVAYLNGLHGRMRTLAGTSAGLQTVSAESDRVLEILDSEPEVRDRPGAKAVVDLCSTGISPVAPGNHGRNACATITRWDVRMESVRFGYEPGHAVLQDVNLAASAGQTVALVGPTGAGKSTLLGLLPRFFDPWQGRVLFDGHDIRDIKLADLRRNISLVLQEPFLFPLSIAQNIAYGKPGAGLAEIERAAIAANAAEFIEQFPDRYDTVIGERGATLSGGQRQRLAIARALLKDAPLLLMDEPTSSLDSRTEASLLEALDRLRKGRTTFVIAHRLSTVRDADQILVLDGGRIVQRGTHVELIGQPGLYATLQARQLEPALIGEDA
jgi:ATP-binding cassette subfamily B protein/subfamily B ATP-binding cassette protein MsbA